MHIGYFKHLGGKVMYTRVSTYWYPDSRIPVCTSFLYGRGTFLTRKVPVDSTTICIIIPGTLAPTYNFFFFATCIIAYGRYYVVHRCHSAQTQWYRLLCSTKLNIRPAKMGLRSSRHPYNREKDLLKSWKSSSRPPI